MNSCGWLFFPSAAMTMWSKSRSWIPLSSGESCSCIRRMRLCTGCAKWLSCSIMRRTGMSRMTGSGRPVVLFCGIFWQSGSSCRCIRIIRVISRRWMNTRTRRSLSTGQNRAVGPSSTTWYRMREVRRRNTVRKRCGTCLPGSVSRNLWSFSEKGCSTISRRNRRKVPSLREATASAPAIWNRMISRAGSPCSMIS